MMDSIIWTAPIFLAVGYVFNIMKHRFCWILWVICSLLWLLYAITKGEYSLISNNIIVLIFMPIGWWKWNKDLKQQRN